MTFVCFIQQFKECAVVSVLVEDGVPTVATIQNVVADITDGRAGCSRHKQSIAKSTQTANKYNVPFFVTRMQQGFIRLAFKQLDGTIRNGGRKRVSTNVVTDVFLS